MGNTLKYHMHPDETPYDRSPLEFDPLYGFPEGARKKKEQRISYAELESMQIPFEYRTFCIHKGAAVKVCEFENTPNYRRCRPYLHEYFACLNEELKDQMKDYERERRLLQRRKRILQKQKERQQLAQAVQ